MNINMVPDLAWIEYLSQGETLSPLSPEEIRVSVKFGIWKIYMHRNMGLPRVHLLSPRSKFLGGWIYEKYKP